MLLEIIKKAVRQLFGQSKVIKQFQARVLELETINEGLRNAHELDSVSLRKAAEAAAVDVASANAKAEDMKAQLAVLEGASSELLAAINDHPDTPIYDEEYNLLAHSGVPAVSDFPANMTPEEITQVEAEAADAPQVPTNLVPEMPSPAVEPVTFEQEQATLKAEFDAAKERGELVGPEPDSTQTDAEPVETTVEAPKEEAAS